MPGTAPHWPPARGATGSAPDWLGNLFSAPDWLLAPTEVRAVSHTRAHVDLGAGAGLKGPRHRPANGRRTPSSGNNGREEKGGSCLSSGKMPGPR